MITIKDFYDIVGKKMATEVSKAVIRNNIPQHIAEPMCDAIDRHEAAEHFQRLLIEYNEWLVNQQRQQETVQAFLREYYK
jgi:hypothetical protein